MLMMYATFALFNGAYVYIIKIMQLFVRYTHE